MRKLIGMKEPPPNGLPKVFPLFRWLSVLFVGSCAACFLASLGGWLLWGSWGWPGWTIDTLFRIDLSAFLPIVRRLSDKVRTANIGWGFLALAAIFLALSALRRE